jgi:acetyl esterase/lipase
MDSRLVTACSITKQVLLYPLTDYDVNYPSVTKFGKGYLLDAEVITYLRPNYFQNGEDHLAKSPLRNSFYPQMPETLVIVADHDPLHDCGVAYQQKLNSIGVKNQLITMSGLVHAYLMIENLCPDECAQTYQDIVQFLRS